MHGILLVDKPSGWTSFDVVAKLRNTLKQYQKANDLAQNDTQFGGKAKVGHTGTLDPLATGLLVLVIGDYCKRAGEFSKLDKTYEVTMKLGETSSTGDGEGIKTVVRNPKSVVREDLEKAFEQFTGEIMQVPPAYSAIKVNGQRAYKLARAGKEVKLEPRNVEVYSLELTDYNHPKVRFTATVSSGTYIRSFVEDLGKALGTGAYMSNLRRTEVGDFKVSNSMQIDDLNIEKISDGIQTVA